MPTLRRAPNERELRAMIQIFLKAETEIINEIGRLRSAGNVDYHAQAALERIQAILRKLESDAWTYAPRMVEKQFYVRVPEARRIAGETRYKHLAGYANAQALSGEQTAIADRLVQNLMGEVTAASVTVMEGLHSALVGRPERDIFRRVGLEQAALQKAVGAGTYKMLPGFVEQLRREGVTAFVDKAGRKWPLHTYGAMVSRTTSRQAEVLAVLTADPEQDLYKISAHGTTCPLCAPYEGRVYSRSGSSAEFPALADAFGKVDPAGPNSLSNTYLNIHPNCLHVLMPWTPAGRSREEIDRIRDFSDPKKNPYSVDPRSAKQIQAYRNKEAARRHYLNDYRQWERYRLTIPGQTPKTFQTFQRHKAAGDEVYRFWELDHKRRSKLLSHPERALPGAETAMAADAKFIKYLFGGHSKDGLAKGRAFSSRLGYNKNNWEEMRKEILAAAAKYPVRYRDTIEYGGRYSQDIILYGKKSIPANVRVGWIVHTDGTVHMTTIHVKEL